MLGVVAGQGLAAEEPAVLDDLVVVNRVEQSAHEVPGAVGVVEPEDLDWRAPSYAVDALRSLPGVDVQGSAYPGTPVKPILRGHAPGLLSKRALVLVDGRRVSEPFQGGVDFTLLGADDIARIEVLRGPASALYGSDALSGVINIITRRGGATPQADARAAFGADDYALMRARLSGLEGPVDYAVSAGHLQTDGYTLNSDGTERDWREERLAGNVGVALGPDSALRLLAGYHGAEGTDENSDREVAKDYQQAEWTCVWDRTRDARLLVRAYRNGDDQRYRWKFPGEGHYDMQTLGGEVQQSLWAGERHQLTGGVDARRESVDATDVAGPTDEDVETLGLYLQDAFMIADALTFTAGLRHDEDADFGGELTPRGALLWRLNEAAEVFAGAARAYRAPSLSDRYFRGEYDGRQFEGNPNLDPETLTAYELGGRARLQERVRFELTGFYNDLEDSFEFTADTDGVFRNRNIARSSTWGVESGLAVTICRRLDTFVNYTFTDGEYDEFPNDPSVEGNRLQYLAPHTAAAGLRLTDPRGGTHGITGRYVAARYSDDRNSPETKLDDYVVVDWRSRVPVGKHAAVTLSIDNLFDESYAEFYQVEQPGLTVLGGFEVAL